jgi:hypothetical protein
MTLGTLLKVLARNEFDVDTRYLYRLAFLMWTAMGNSVFRLLEVAVNSRKIEADKIAHPPLFIIGHWRSGTTHLHNLLCLDENFTYPTAFQAMFPHHFVFSQGGTSVFNIFSPKKRPMDDVAFSALVPHEDEFGLAAMTAASPYLRAFFPARDGGDYGHLDLLKLPAEIREQWKNALVHFLKKVILCRDGRLLLKSPPHQGRVSVLLELFPQAQFIHIVRNPYDVYLSTKKLWRNSFSLAHLQEPDPHVIDQLILSWYVELFALFERDRVLIPQNNLHELKYEDLDRDPIVCLQEIYNRLNLPGFEALRPRAVAYLSSIRGYTKNAYQLDAESREKVSTRWRSTFDRYGYPI